MAEILAIALVSDAPIIVGRLGEGRGVGRKSTAHLEHVMSLTEVVPKTGGDDGHHLR